MNNLFVMFKSVDHHNPSLELTMVKKCGSYFLTLCESTTPIQYNQILETPMYHVTDWMLLIRSTYPIADIIIGTIITSQLAGL